MALPREINRNPLEKRKSERFINIIIIIIVIVIVFSSIAPKNSGLLSRTSLVRLESLRDAKDPLSSKIRTSHPRGETTSLAANRNGTQTGTNVIMYRSNRNFKKPKYLYPGISLVDVPGQRECDVCGIYY